MTSYTFDRGAMYGDAEFLSNLDPDALLTKEQYAELRSLFVEKVNALVEAYDSSLSWFPYISEVYGIVDVTETDREDFREWWRSGADGAFENALIEAWEEIEKNKGDQK